MINAPEAKCGLGVPGFYAELGSRATAGDCFREFTEGCDVSLQEWVARYFLEHSEFALKDARTIAVQGTCVCFEVRRLGEPVCRGDGRYAHEEKLRHLVSLPRVVGSYCQNGD